ncbi:MAG TPA: tRNA (adenosine(37)-N6)-dimethylallyltransferase MiaA [Ottowia sp.]|uniref:tRNA (adenosine(37)-N6)-dimethylallyltransferase MiaA n=1 Tax=Ottowia sp. TaxID=1898956 RepID=UPI002C366806|nr:tRNA (adenosine(37)-N6)-dimethylallyltransferase MiaA [Ottowia sp.]HMN21160.1 tRNA (adenosine(37)-N6)-dimethylallyltransferase MiaA [Ottowia sp.]
MSVPPLRAVCLAGPTASGKSALALALATHVPLEIISVDSAQVYRGLDIGSAKPTAAERAAVPHHLIDVRDPTEPYSAAEFARDARRLVLEIQARGRLPLLVGGTMLYFKALLEGLDELPPADPALRRALEAQARTHGWPALHAELATVDPVTAARLAPADSQRIQRALEVWRLTGRPLSSFHAEHGTARTRPSPGAMPPFFSLEPDDRAWLHARIAARFDAMLAAGLLDEVRALRARGDLSPALPALRAVGYRQAWQALDEHWPPGQLRERVIAATRQLAKRQLTWLRAVPGRRRLVADAADAQARALDAMLQSIRT